MDDETASNIDLGKRLLEVIPLLMHMIKAEIRVAAKERMTVPQFRILAAIKRGLQYTGQIAEHHGVSQPTMSKMVNGLVKRGLVKRLSEKDDRRQSRLVLTTKGTALFSNVKNLSRRRLNERLSGFTHEERKRLLDALFQIESLVLRQETK